MGTPVEDGYNVFLGYIFSYLFEVQNFLTYYFENFQNPLEIYTCE